MALPLSVFQPQSFTQFRCIGSACEDPCCDGMGVVLDKDTYEKYRNCREPQLKALINLHVSSNRTNPSEINYAMIQPSRGSTCPFLSEARLCVIQEKLGESHLSRTCSVYPRAISTVDGVTERSLYLSCPEAARLVLLNPEPIPFEMQSAGFDPDPRLRGFPVLDTTQTNHGNKPYHAFHDVRAFIVSLLQNRTYRLWERLIILGMFCEQLHTLGGDAGTEQVGEVIASFGGFIRDGLFGATLDNVTVQPVVQLSFLLNAIEYRVHSEPVGERFLECYRDFLDGIGFTADDADIDGLNRRYTEAYAHHDAFMETHEYLLENYVVNYVFRTLFPFGAQSAAIETRSIFDEYVLLIIQFALVRSLMVGMAGHHRNVFTTDHCVKLIQSFAKAVEHNPPYLKRVAQSLAENQMTDLAVLAVLIKSPAREDTITTPKVPAGSRVVLKAPARVKKASAEPVAPHGRPASRRARRTRTVPTR